MMKKILITLVLISLIGSLSAAGYYIYKNKILNKNPKKPTFTFWTIQLKTPAGRFIEDNIETFKKKGSKSVFFCRLVPILRSLISIPAGLSKMNFLLFLTLTTVGSLIWNIILILLGNMVGENYYLVADFISSYYKFIILAFIIIYIIVKRHKAKKIITIK